jgi:hypothetical protein
MGSYRQLMECPRCHQPMREIHITGTSSYGGWCACGYSYYDDFD